MSLPIAEQLFYEVAERKAQAGDAIVKRDANNNVCGVETTPQLDNRISLNLAERALYTVTKYLRASDCN